MNMDDLFFKSSSSDSRDFVMSLPRFEAFMATKSEEEKAPIVAGIKNNVKELNEYLGRLSTDLFGRQEELDNFLKNFNNARLSIDLDNFSVLKNLNDASIYVTLNSDSPKALSNDKMIDLVRGLRAMKAYASRYGHELTINFSPEAKAFLSVKLGPQFVEDFNRVTSDEVTLAFEQYQQEQARIVDILNNQVTQAKLREVEKLATADNLKTLIEDAALSKIAYLQKISQSQQEVSAAIREVLNQHVPTYKNLANELQQVSERLISHVNKVREMNDNPNENPFKVLWNNFVTNVSIVPNTTKYIESLRKILDTYHSSVQNLVNSLEKSIDPALSDKLKSDIADINLKKAEALFNVQKDVDRSKDEVIKAEFNLAKSRLDFAENYWRHVTNRLDRQDRQDERYFSKTQAELARLQAIEERRQLTELRELNKRLLKGQLNAEEALKQEREEKARQQKAIREAEHQINLIRINELGLTRLFQPYLDQGVKITNEIVLRALGEDKIAQEILLSYDPINKTFTAPDNARTKIELLEASVNRFKPEAVQRFQVILQSPEFQSFLNSLKVRSEGKLPSKAEAILEFYKLSSMSIHSPSNPYYIDPNTVLSAALNFEPLSSLAATIDKTRKVNNYKELLELLAVGIDGKNYTVSDVARNFSLLMQEFVKLNNRDYAYGALGLPNQTDYKIYVGPVKKRDPLKSMLSAEDLVNFKDLTNPRDVQQLLLQIRGERYHNR